MMETKDMVAENFSYSFKTKKTSDEIFRFLLNIENWWNGLYGETTTGKNRRPDDEFIFKAGEGAHFSKQRLVELTPNKKIVWLVTESHLSFLHNPEEWTRTKIRFDISREGDETRVTFTHEGLVPGIECYDACSGAWKQYMHNLEKRLN